jgi:hypothetical protein
MRWTVFRFWKVKRRWTVNFVFFHISSWCVYLTYVDHVFRWFRSVPIVHHLEMIAHLVHSWTIIYIIISSSLVIIVELRNVRAQLPSRAVNSWNRADSYRFVAVLASARLCSSLFAHQYLWWTAVATGMEATEALRPPLVDVIKTIGIDETTALAAKEATTEMAGVRLPSSDRGMLNALSLRFCVIFQTRSPDTVYEYVWPGLLLEQARRAGEPHPFADDRKRSLPDQRGKCLWSSAFVLSTLVLSRL